MNGLLQALLHNARQRSGQIALADDVVCLTWDEVAARVGGALAQMDEQATTVGIAGHNSVHWVITFLAAWLAGKVIVPVPPFFSPRQVAALVQDAGIDCILADETIPDSSDLRTLGVPLKSLAATCAPLQDREADNAGRLIIYTSGTTGRPKGVRLFSGQAIWTAQALAEAVQAHADDRYLSVLPLSMLLEIIGAILVPTLVGGSTFFAPELAEAAVVGAPADIAGRFWQVRPTRSVMVPQQLAQYAGQLAALDRRPPVTLRFVAVGGAMLPPTTARAARQVGIPFFEGYGLSECGSVVSLNLPGQARVGTVGRPLPGLQVEMDDGEIVVRGPAVMDGYLHDSSRPQLWRTGDLGALDEDGFLRVFGRKDNVLVSQTGRNISPEWIEAMALADEHIAACVLTLSPCRTGPGMLLVPAARAEAWFDDADDDAVLRLLQRACADAPAYARPQWALVLSQAEALRRGILRRNGTPHREMVARLVARHHHQQQAAEEKQ